LAREFPAQPGRRDLGGDDQQFLFNNVFTYGDQRLRGRAMWRGLLSFYAACGIGALINLAIAEWSVPQIPALLGRPARRSASIAALMELLHHGLFTLGRSSAARGADAAR